MIDIYRNNWPCGTAEPEGQVLTGRKRPRGEGVACAWHEMIIARAGRQSRPAGSRLQRQARGCLMP